MEKKKILLIIITIVIFIWGINNIIKLDNKLKKEIKAIEIQKERHRKEIQKLENGIIKKNKVITKLNIRDKQQIENIKKLSEKQKQLLKKNKTIKKDFQYYKDNLFDLSNLDIDLKLTNELARQNIKILTLSNNTIKIDYQNKIYLLEFIGEHVFLKQINNNQIKQIKNLLSNITQLNNRIKTKDDIIKNNNDIIEDKTKQLNEKKQIIALDIKEFSKIKKRLSTKTWGTFKKQTLPMVVLAILVTLVFSK